MNDKILGHILIVDDQKEVCEFLSSILSLEGYKVFTTNSGQDALNMLDFSHSTYQDDIDLILPT